MKQATKAVLAVVLAAAWPACFAQTTPSGAETASPAGAGPASSPPIPIPRAGDPFYAPIATAGVPQTFHQRLMDLAVVTVGPRALMTPAFSSGISMLRPPKDYPADWKDGIGAFGRMYGSRLATRTSQQSARFLTAAVLHEDFRYRPSTSTNVVERTFHAVAFTFVDRSDSGGNRIAFANFASAAAGGFTPNLYMPPGYNTLSRAESRMATAFVGFAARNLTREFAPELFRATHRMHLPFPRIPVPDWWTPRQ